MEDEKFEMSPKELAEFAHLSVQEMKKSLKLQENELLPLAKKGNKNAVESLLKKYTPLVYSECKDKYLPGAGIEDLMQEGMMGVIEAIRDYDLEGGASFTSFVLLCVRRKIATELKLANRKKHTPLNTYVSFQQKVDGDEGITYEEEIQNLDNMQDLQTPDEILIRREDEALLNDKLCRMLTATEFNVLVGILNGESYEEIAEKEGITKKSVDNARQRIKAKLLKQKI